jgi:hypothetical protein
VWSYFSFFRPSRPASSPRSNLRQSPLSGRSAKSPRTSDPTNPQFSANQDGAGANGNSAAAWSVENQALWEKNGRILYEAIGRVTNKKWFNVVSSAHVDWCNPDKYDETPLMKVRYF